MQAILTNHLQGLMLNDPNPTFGGAKMMLIIGSANKKGIIRMNINVYWLPGPFLDESYLYFN